MTLGNQNVTKFFEVTSYEDDIITISRIGSGTAAWDKVHGLKDKSSFVRKDQILEPSAEYNQEEWIEYKNDSLSTDFNNFERHPHDPLISEITDDSNAKQGVHIFGPVETENLHGRWKIVLG